MKASGVYYSLTDSSQQVAGSSRLEAITLLKAVKGKIGELITVTAQDFVQKLGYDLSYNPNYLGLKYMLDSISKLQVLRINVSPFVANAYFVDATSPASTIADCESFEELAAINPKPVIFAGHNSPGNWGTFAFSITKSGGTQVGSKAFTSGALPILISLGDLGTFDLDATETWEGLTVFTNVKFGFDSTNTLLLS